MATHSKQSFLEISLPSDVKVCVGNNIHQMTSYVLLEQEDWFEDEMPFIRSIVQPGMVALDIGANHGVYALTIAKLLDGIGHVWAIEPASEPASLLRKSVEANGVNEVLTLIQCALSDHEGSAMLQLGGSSELNTLQGGSGGRTEKITLRTLDSVADQYIDRQVDFIKLDAEGEETKVISGGTRFFEKHSPLVMFELKHGSTVNTELCNVFSKLGMQNYYLVPGLNALVPVDNPDSLDEYTLNLFACSDQTAAEFASRGFLITRQMLSIHEDLNAFLSGYDWKSQLLSKSISSQFTGEALKDIDKPSLYHLSLAALIAFEDNQLPLIRRFSCGLYAKVLFEELFQNQQKSIAVVFAYIRLLRGLGYRATAVGVLGKNLPMIESLPEARLPILWLPLHSDWDNVEQNTQLSSFSFRLMAWQMIEMWRALSSYFTSDDSLVKRAIAVDKTNPFWLRRFALISMRKGKKIKIGEDSALLSGPNDRHKNPIVWRDIQQSSSLRQSVGLSVSHPAVDSMVNYIRLSDKISIVDIGASSLGQDSEPYAKLINLGVVKLIGFEPNKDECAKVSACNPGHLYLPFFIGKGGSETFYETNWPLTGSLFKPNREILEKFTFLPEFVQLKAEHSVQTRSLDSFSEIEDVDLVKIDVQGAELSVFQGAQRVLSNTLVVMTEVEFIPLYEGQPLFSDVDCYLRKQGFLLHSMSPTHRRAMTPFNYSHSTRANLSVLWSDFVYIRDFRYWHDLPLSKLRKLVVLLHDIVAAYDMCYQVLKIMDEKGSDNNAEPYLRWCVEVAKLDVQQ